MKSRAYLFLVLSAAIYGLFAQSPDGFNYQAVVRNTAGEVLSNQAVGIRMSLIQGAANGAVIYQETFSKTTNAFGLIDLVVGKGTAASGTFAAIDWAAGPYFLETAIDQNGGSNYAVLGTSQLMSVPFAMYAASSANDGADGQDGAAGASAYEVWLSQGNSGTEADFLASLEGPQGPAGADGEGLTPSIQAEIDANTAKVGITPEQANAIAINSTDPDTDETNELQDIALSGSDLSISDGSTVDLSGIDTNTQLSEQQVDDFVSNNGYLTGFTEVDGDATNEIQTLTLSEGGLLAISEGNAVQLADPSSTNELQFLTLESSTLLLNKISGSTPSTVDLSGLIDDADANPGNELQTLELIEGGEVLRISEGNFVTLTDFSPSNELNTSVVLNGTVLETTDAGGTIPTDLTPLLDAETDPVFAASDVSAVSTADIDNWNATSSQVDGTYNNSDWDATTTTVNEGASSWDAAAATVANGAADWDQAATTLDGTYNNTTWDATAATVTAGATSWNETATTVTTNEADWTAGAGDTDDTNEIQDLEVIGSTIRITGNENATEITLQAQHSYGDIKHSFKMTDHDGWYVLDGRDLADLNDFARNNAEEFFSIRLPNASDRFLKANDGSETYGDDSGGSDLISQANLPAYNLSGGSTNLSGSHDHGGTTDNGQASGSNYSSRSLTSRTDVSTIGSGIALTNVSINTSSDNHNHGIPIAPDHSHSITSLPSGGGGASYEPKHIVTNIFVYLGGTTLQDLQDLGKTPEEILAAGISPFTVWQDDPTLLAELLTYTYQDTPITLQTLVDQNIPLASLYSEFGNALLALNPRTVTTLDLFNANPQVTIDEMATAAVPLSEMIADGIPLRDLESSTSFDHQDLKDAGISLLAFNAASFSVEELRTQTDFPLSAFLDENYSLNSLVSGGFTLQQLKDEGVTVADFLAEAFPAAMIDEETDFTLQELFDGGAAVSDLISVGYTLEVLRQVGVTVTQFFDAGVIVSDLITQTNFTAAAYAAAGVNISDLYGVFDIQDLVPLYSIAELLTESSVEELLNDSDLTVQELRSAGVDASDFHGVAFGGGLIFATTSTGETYIAENQDISTGIIWAAIGGVSTGNNVGAGLANSNAIVAFDPGPNAASICLDLTDSEGFDDWFLPSDGELDLVYSSLKAKGFGSFENQFYWTSSDNNNSEARATDFTNGTNASGSERSRTNLYRVRPVRFVLSAPQ